ncbi:unnamed protein product [Chrysodeixis includens]|uniref:Receptor expression-enhancing protein 1 n=1 Tax=Chrysodeixis includens TaxID=689277 RepID=A0A9N8KW03_CHRIL|nr:unnamed protein product [Chrysodeixis includens]
MISSIISRLVILVFGTLYPAYASYKAVRTKNLKEYVKWMMYWIVFALFTCTETFTDVFLSWFPFYYEVKIVLVLWLLSPATKGSSILYRKFVHPALCRREQEIDEYIAKAKDQGYHTVLNLGTKGVNYATTVIMQTAIKGGGGLVQQLRKSYSLSDLTECEPREERGSDEADDVLAEPRLIRRGGKSGFTTRRSASESNSRSPMYFPEVDVDVRPRPRSDEPDFSHIKSSEDISSGYSSADNSASLTRTSSLGAGARARGRTSRTTVTTIKRPQAAEESEVIIEELQDDDSFEYANMPALINLPSQVFLSHTQPPFIYQYVGDQVKILQVLGNFPLDANVDKQSASNTDHRDQKDINSVKTLSDNLVEKDNTINESIIKQEDIVKENDIVCDIPVASQQKDNKEEQCSTNKKELDDTATKEIDSVSLTESTPHTETTSFETSANDNDSVESDDEASFGTPDHSPKSKRKFPKGKHGKGKAPPPPKDDIDEVIDVKQDVLSKSDTETIPDSNLSQESSDGDMNKLPDISIQEAVLSRGLTVNPTPETKKRHKSKSPARAPKGNSSGFGKLLQLPGKLAFWNKSEEKPKSDSSTSTSSGDNSRRSSTIERTVDDFQSCTELNTLVDDETKVLKDQTEVQEFDKGDDQISFADACDLGDAISDKSNALQRLIEAKIESHPEYKIISLHEDTPTTSKSTDV